MGGKLKVLQVSSGLDPRTGGTATAAVSLARGGNAALRRAKRHLRDWYLRHVDRIVVSSDLEARDSALGDDPRCIALAHPVLDESLAPSAPPESRSPGAPLRVGFLGRFHPKKNLHLLVEALAGAPGAQL